MKKAMLIINPRAGKAQLVNKLYGIIHALSEQYTVTVCPTKERGHATQMASIAKADGFDLVVCAGGDGTLNETVCGLMTEPNPLPLGYIPAGSTNDFAAGLGLCKNPVKAAKAIAEGTPHFQDIGLFNGERKFTYVASFGAFTEVSYATDQSLKNTLGHMAYLLQGVKSLTKIKAIPMDVFVNGEKIAGEFLFGAVTNATSIGGMLKLKDEHLNFDDGLFEVLLIHKPKNILELNGIVTHLLRYEYDGKNVQLLRSPHVEFCFDGNLDWSVDGERASSRNHVLVENLQHGLQLIY